MPDVSVDFASSIIHAVPEKGLEPSRGVASADFELMVMHREVHEGPDLPTSRRLEMHEEAGCLTPASPQVLRGGAWRGSKSAPAEKIVGQTSAPGDVGADDLVDVLKKSLRLAVDAEQWGLVAALARQLEGLAAPTILKGGMRAI